jgi:hypothetical protein
MQYACGVLTRALSTTDMNTHATQAPHFRICFALLNSCGYKILLNHTESDTNNPKLAILPEPPWKYGNLPAQDDEL